MLRLRARTGVEIDVFFCGGRTRLAACRCRYVWCRSGFFSWHAVDEDDVFGVVVV
jgi:hypothetical protein